MKYFIIAGIILYCIVSAFSQNAAVPKYLTTQDFPDSVKLLGLRTLTNTRLTFGKMLEIYKGKKVMIDIWGSWCSDCIVGHPKLEEFRRNAGETNKLMYFCPLTRTKRSGGMRFANSIFVGNTTCWMGHG